MNYEDFRDTVTETVRDRLVEDELSDDQYNSNFETERSFNSHSYATNSSNLDETPEIASEVCSN